MNTDAKIVFFGFSDVGYRCLKLLLDYGCNVAAVVTHDTDPQESQWFKTPESLAKQNCIDVFKPKTLKTEKWIRKIKYMKPDLILSLYYRNIIPEEIFKSARLGAYNMHGSYLPAYRGRAPLNWSIINGENHCGVSLHVIEKGFDTGAVVRQTKVEFGDDEYVADIQPRVSDAAVETLQFALPSLLEGNPKLVPQDESKATYFRKRTPEDGRIDFTKTAKEVFNLVRAVSKPFPGAFTDDFGKRLVIWRARVGEETKGESAGSGVLEKPFKIACSDRYLIVEESEVREIPEC